MDKVEQVMDKSVVRKGELKGDKGSVIMGPRPIGSQTSMGGIERQTTPMMISDPAGQHQFSNEKLNFSLEIDTAAGEQRHGTSGKGQWK